MGEPVEIPQEIHTDGFWAYYAVHSLRDGVLKNVVIDLNVEKRNVVENHIIASPGDEIHTFVGANSTLGILLMRFDSMEEMLEMMDNADRWIQIAYM